MLTLAAPDLLTAVPPGAPFMAPGLPTPEGNGPDFAATMAELMTGTAPAALTAIASGERQAVAAPGKAVPLTPAALPALPAATPAPLPDLPVSESPLADPPASRDEAYAPAVDATDEPAADPALAWLVVPTMPTPVPIAPTGRWPGREAAPPRANGADPVGEAPVPSVARVPVPTKIARYATTIPAAEPRSPVGAVPASAAPSEPLTSVSESASPFAEPTIGRGKRPTAARLDLAQTPIDLAKVGLPVERPVAAAPAPSVTVPVGLPIAAQPPAMGKIVSSTLTIPRAPIMTLPTSAAIVTPGEPLAKRALYVTPAVPARFISVTALGPMTAQDAPASVSPVGVTRPDGVSASAPISVTPAAPPTIDRPVPLIVTPAATHLAAQPPRTVVERPIAAAIPTPVLRTDVVLPEAALPEATALTATGSADETTGPLPRIDAVVLAATGGTSAQATSPIGAATGPGIDLTRDPGLHRIIDRIEVLRDAAADQLNARDTRIRLIPDALGPVDISVRREGEGVHVHFTATEAATRQLIADAQPRLSELAEQRGVRLERATVDAGTAHSGGQTGADSGQSRPQQHQPAVPVRPMRTAASEPDTHDERIA